MPRKPVLKVEAGQRFGRLVVVDPDGRKPGKSGAGRRAPVCRCDCGETAQPQIDQLIRGDTKSCGCLRRDTLLAAKAAMTEEERADVTRRAVAGRTKHGLRARTAPGAIPHPLYSTWSNMMKRCYAGADHPDWKNYGERGIKVCPDWHDPVVFVTWIEQNLGIRPSGHTLDRLEVDGDYEPGNVQWADAVYQASNRRPWIALRRVAELEEENRALKEEIASLRRELESGEGR